MGLKLCLADASDGYVMRYTKRAGTMVVSFRLFLTTAASGAAPTTPCTALKGERI